MTWNGSGSRYNTYQGRWNAPERKRELPPNWDALRLDILRRDGYQCRWVEDNQRCRSKATHVDHIERGTNHLPSNLQALCAAHHQLKTAREAQEARYGLVRRRGQLVFEDHPGLVR